MKLRHRLEHTAWWLLTDVAPTLILYLVVAAFAYTQGEIDAFKLIDTLEVCP